MTVEFRGQATMDSSISNRERLMTVLRGRKADRVPFTIYAWIYRWAPEGISVEQRPYAPLLTMIDTCAVCKESAKNVVVERKEAVENGRRQILTRISTPLGDLTERAEFDVSFQSRWIREHLVKSVDDYPIIKYICDHTQLEPAPEDYRQADAAMGERGIVVGGLPPIPLA